MTKMKMESKELAIESIRICEGAMHLDKGERKEFIKIACKGNKELEDLVKTLVENADNAGSFLERKSGAETKNEIMSLVGTEVSHYKIESLLDEGGMGSVYLATRKVEGYKQKVALKVIRKQLLSDQLLSRFNEERKILASLNHPYIASLIDAGTTKDGMPFFVMEYVEGLPIDQYCDENRLSLAQRLTLVIKVSLAVQTAHQNFIIHRDLKPNNILITKDGIPKLLDFGVAKILQSSDVNPSSNNKTLIGHQAISPNYASPEQILDSKVTTASDVYSLGVLTYQLLTGLLPYQIKTDSYRSIVKSVETMNIQNPSIQVQNATSKNGVKIALNRQATPNKLVRSLNGDLDTILLKALHRESERRYQTVTELAQDFQRYLLGQPVLAREDSFVYRASKFAKRHWIGILASSLVILSLVGGMVATSFQANEAKKQRDIAQREAQSSNSTLRFLKSILFSADPWKENANELTIDQMLSKSEEYLIENYQENPATRAYIFSALAEIFAARGNYKKSEQYALNSITILSQLDDKNTPDIQNKLALVNRVHGLSLYYLGKYQESDERLNAAINIYKSLSNPDWNSFVRGYDQLAVVKKELNQEVLAEQFFKQAILLYQQQQVDDLTLLITVQNNLAVLYLQQGNYQQSANMFERTIANANKSDISEPIKAMLFANLAGSQKNIGLQERSLDNYLKAVKLQTNSIGAEHPEAIVTATSLGNLYQQLGQLGRAERVLKNARTSAEKAFGMDHPLMSYVQSILGSVLCNADKGEEGLLVANRSLSTRQKLMPEGHWAIASSEGVVGRCLVSIGQFEKAEEILLPAYQKLLEQRGEDNEATKATKYRIFQLYTSWDKIERAKKYK